jgi:hypothetical protein
MDNFGMCGLLINGTPLDTYEGAALLDYSVGETAIKNETFQGINRSTWHLLKSIYGVRQIKLTIVFTGPSRREVALQRSKLNGALFGASELFISDDGFFYDVTVESCGPEILVGEGAREVKIKSDYTFTGTRRDALVTETITGGGSIFCASTLPYTDARLTATVGTSAASYTLCGATFGAVTAGDVLVFDGIDGKITKNGANAAASVSWTEFPQLVPGENTITAPDAVTVEYYPTYI